MINFRYLDSAYIELSSDINFIPKLSSLEVKTQSQRQHRQKTAVPIYEVYRYLPKGLMKAGGAPDPFLPCLKSPQAMEAVAAVDSAEYAAWQPKCQYVLHNMLTCTNSLGFLRNMTYFH